MKFYKVTEIDEDTFIERVGDYDDRNDIEKHYCEEDGCLYIALNDEYEDEFDVSIDELEENENG